MSKTLVESMRETIDSLTAPVYETKLPQDTEGLTAEDFLVQFLRLSEEDRLAEFNLETQVGIGHYNSLLFPSGWCREWRDIPYPAELAYYLVRSYAEESLMDIGNIYYAKRRIEKKAQNMLRERSLQGNDGSYDYMSNASPEEMAQTPQVEEVFRHERDFAIASFNANLTPHEVSDLMQILSRGIAGDSDDEDDLLL